MSDSTIDLDIECTPSISKKSNYNPEPKECFIYCLVDPRTKQKRYIGLSTRGMKRVNRHKTLGQLRREFSHKANWIKELLKLGLCYEVEVLERLESEDGLVAAEIRWIAHGRSQGWPLTNATDGGDGLINPSAETRAKMAAATREKMRDPEYKERIHSQLRGRKLSPEHRAKFVAGRIGRKRSAESIAKAVAKTRGVKRGPMSDEQKKKISDCQKGKKLSDSHRAKISASHKGKIFSTVAKQRMKEAQRRRFDRVAEEKRIAREKKSGIQGELF